jgi:HD-like signal output (HDOD) protein/CheY-like chemotaxis protein
MMNLLFVDDEARVLQGLQRQLRFMRQEWNMNFVEGGHQALEFMAANPVDIIVSDMMMPGMDGSQLLLEVVQRHPQTVRIVLSGHAEREAIMRLVGPAHQYLSKPCDPVELRQAITDALALRDLLGNERLKQLTTQIKHLPTLPTLQSQFTEELRKDSPSIDRIGEIISRDIGMTAKILQLVNSAFFGLAQPVNNPTEAVSYLGLNTIHSLALSVGIFSQYDQKICKSFSLEVLANHSWTTGMMARRIAQREKQELKTLDKCLLAGMLHDVGQLVLAFGLSEEYAEVIARAKAENTPIWSVEQQTFGASHAEVGAYLLGLWGLPGPIIEALACHHQPTRASTKGFSPALAVHAADVFAHQFAVVNTEMPAPKLDLPYLQRTGFAEHAAMWAEDCEELLKV